MTWCTLGKPHYPIVVKPCLYLKSKSGIYMTGRNDFYGQRHDVSGRSESHLDSGVLDGSGSGFSRGSETGLNTQIQNPLKIDLFFQYLLIEMTKYK